MNVCGWTNSIRRPFRSARATLAWNFFSGAQAARQLFRQSFHQLKPDIVPGPGILGPGISQPHDEMQILHAAGRVWRPNQLWPPEKLFLLLGLFLARPWPQPAFRPPWPPEQPFVATPCAAAPPLAGAAPSAPSSFFSLIISTSRSASGARFGSGGFLRFTDRRRHGNDGDMLVTQNFHSRGRLDVADVDGLADFQMADIHRDDFRQILRQSARP